jgi:hypothetical protein
MVVQATYRRKCLANPPQKIYWLESNITSILETPKKNDSHFWAGLMDKKTIFFHFRSFSIKDGG